MNIYTEVERCILRVLSDGKAHAKEELLSAMPDELTSVNTLRVNISKLRKKLKNKGQDIICKMANRRGLYQHVRLLAIHHTEKP